LGEAEIIFSKTEELIRISPKSLILKGNSDDMIYFYHIKSNLNCKIFIFPSIIVCELFSPKTKYFIAQTFDFNQNINIFDFISKEVTKELLRLVFIK
jgi:WD40 repeat protein